MSVSLNTLILLISTTFGDDAWNFKKKKTHILFQYYECQIKVDKFFMASEIVDSKSIKTAVSTLITKLLYLENKEVIEEYFRNEKV